MESGCPGDGNISSPLEVSQCLIAAEPPAGQVNALLVFRGAEKRRPFSRAVHKDARAAHVARKGGGEEQADVADVGGISEAAERNRRGDARDSVLVSIVKVGLLGT